MIGARCVIQDGAVIGSDGFGFAHRDDGTHEKIPQVAAVVIEDDVEIGANTTIDRPAVGETRIGRVPRSTISCRLPMASLVGKNSLLAAQVGIAGSTVLGDGVMLGGQVGVTGHVTVGSRREGLRENRCDGQCGATTASSPAIRTWRTSEWRKAYAVCSPLAGIAPPA